MRIGIDIRELEKGKFTGIGRYLSDFVSYTARNDPGNEYILFGNQRTEPPAPAENQRLVIIRETFTPWWDQVRLPLALKREKIGVFLSPYFKAPLLPPGKNVLIINDLIPLKLPRGGSAWRRWCFTSLAKLTARRADRIICISEATKRGVIETFRVSSKKIRVVHLGIGEIFRPLTPKPQVPAGKHGLGEEFILYVGNLKPHKNLSRLIEAYHCLPQDVRDKFQLVILARKDRDYQALANLIREKGLKKRVVFLDPLPEPDLVKLYNMASLFVLPSLAEGFGLPALEAMSCGVPVVASRSSSLPEVVGDAGLLVNPKEPEDIARAIKKILQEEELAKTLASKGLARARQFSGERMCKGFLVAIKETGERNAAAR